MWLCIAIILNVFLVGCSNTQISSRKSYAKTVKNLPASTSIQQLTKDTISDRYKHVTNINFEDYKDNDNVNYLAFAFNDNQLPYFGFTVAGKSGNGWNLAYFEEIPNDQKQPILLFQFIGTYPGTEKQQFHISAGYVNNKKIQQILLYYPNSNIKIIQLAEDQHGFLDIDMNSKNSLLKIEGKSSKGEILYQKDFDKS
jgi:hypothetical protein